jgi:hypothetical protein
MAAGDDSAGPLHLIKMAVGATDLDHLRRNRAERTAERGWSAVYTRNRPRREAEVLDGGSLYWVIRGQIRARQRVLALHAERDENGRAYCLIETASEVIATLLRPFRPFQGWRYLRPVDAPSDAGGSGDLGADAPPEVMLKELRELGLI